MEQREIEASRLFVQGKLFVVVEDDALISQATRIVLENMGGTVECFGDAESALRYSNIGNAHCFIVDYKLSGTVDGLNFLSLLHQKLRRPICAVMMSGDTSEQFSRKAEFFDWPVLQKPVNASKLISRLSEQYAKCV